MKITEDKLSAAIRSGRFDRVYLLYGKEPFLTKMYADRIIKKAAGDDPLDFNLVKIEGNPDIETFTDHIDGLPVFADMKVVAVNDPKPDEMDKATLERIIEIIADVPETTILIFYTTGTELSDKKANSKKFIAAAEKHGTVCVLDEMQPSKIAELAVKKAAKGGIVMSFEDAMYLTERVNGSMVSVSEETAKLMSYAGSGGTITRETINSLVPKQLDAGIYELATAINSGKRAEAYRITDELFLEQCDSTVIMSALSGAYLDLYRGKLAKSEGISPDRAAEEFGYGKRGWVLNKMMTASAKLSKAYLRETVNILSEADLKLKSTPVDKKTIIEEAVTRLFIAREEIN